MFNVSFHTFWLFWTNLNGSISTKLKNLKVLRNTYSLYNWILQFSIKFCQFRKENMCFERLHNNTSWFYLIVLYDWFFVGVRYCWFEYVLVTLKWKLLVSLLESFYYITFLINAKTHIIWNYFRFVWSVFDAIKKTFISKIKKII